MHMTDALLSPAVGVGFYVISGAALALASGKLKRQLAQHSELVPLMGVLGAFVFAAQMINFSIPGTGSSGHLSGALLLAILLGPWAGVLVVASVLLVQALFFADGGLLAYGANVFNMGIIGCFAIYPLVFRPLAGDYSRRERVMAAAVISGMLSAALGAVGVSLETYWSGITVLPLREFLMLMVPIHLAIGLVEGMITGALVLFVLRVQPDLLMTGRPVREAASTGRHVLAKTVFVAALLVGGVVSWFASANPDGLEWAIDRMGATGHVASEAPPDTLHAAAAAVQEKLAVMPDYALPAAADTVKPAGRSGESLVAPQTSLAGIVGSLATLGLLVGLGLLLRQRQRCRPSVHPHP